MPCADKASVVHGKRGSKHRAGSRFSTVRYRIDQNPIWTSPIELAVGEPVEQAYSFLLLRQVGEAPTALHNASRPSHRSSDEGGHGMLPQVRWPTAGQTGRKRIVDVGSAAGRKELGYDLLYG